MAGRPALLPARDDGPHRRRGRPRGGESNVPHGELTDPREDDALLHHILGLDRAQLDDGYSFSPTMGHQSEVESMNHGNPAWVLGASG